MYGQDWQIRCKALEDKKFWKKVVFVISFGFLIFLAGIGASELLYIVVDFVTQGR